MASASYMRQWRADNPQRAADIDRRSKAKRTESIRAYKREYAVRWRAQNPSRAKATAQRFAEKHREKISENAKVRYYADVAKSRAYARLKAEEKRQWLAGIKMASGCVDCGFKVHPDALQFDHLPQHEKSFNIGPGRGKNKKTVLAEIAKCEIRCANCHAIKTALRRLNG